jgi:hypothetical protein
MKIKENTPDRLVIEDRPILLAVLLSLFILIVAAGAVALAMDGRWAKAGLVAVFLPIVGAVLVIFVRRIILFLDRSADVALLRAVTLRGQTETRWPLDSVTGAVVQTSSDGDGPAHRPALTLADGTTAPLTPVYTSGGGAARATTAINGWLQHPRP